DHPELERRALALDRHPASIDEQHQEEGGRREQVAGAEVLGCRALDRRVERVRQVGPRDEGDREEDEDQRRLHERGDRLGAARAEGRVDRARVDARERGHEAGEPEQERAAEDVASAPERQREARQHRDQEGDRAVAGDGDDRGELEERRGALGPQRLLAEELRDVVVGLQDARPRRDWSWASSFAITPLTSGPKASTLATCSTWIVQAGNVAMCAAP